MINQQKTAHDSSDLLQLIYRSRPDVQAAFPDPFGRDRLGFLRWLLSYGRRELFLDDDVLAPFRDQFHTLLGSLKTFPARLVQRLIYLAMCLSAAPGASPFEIFAAIQRALLRSEERRVGKECRL